MDEKTSKDQHDSVSSFISDHPEKKKDIETPKKDPVTPQLEPVGSPTSYKKQHQTAVQRLASLNSISSSSSRNRSNKSTDSNTKSTPNKNILQNSSVNSANYLFDEKNRSEKESLDDSPENVQNSSTYGNFNNLFEGDQQNPEISKSSWSALPGNQPTVKENITIGSNLSLFDKTQSKPDWATVPQMNGQARNFQNRNFQPQNDQQNNRNNPNRNFRGHNRNFQNPQFNLEKPNFQGSSGYAQYNQANYNQIAGSNKEGPEGCNIFVGHLPRELDDNYLVRLFEPFANLISAKVYVDKKTKQSRCFGFVSYEDPDSARRAIQYRHGYQVMDKMMDVKLKIQTKQHQQNPYFSYYDGYNQMGGKFHHGHPPPPPPGYGYPMDNMQSYYGMGHHPHHHHHHPPPPPPEFHGYGQYRQWPPHSWDPSMMTQKPPHINEDYLSMQFNRMNMQPRTQDPVIGSGSEGPDGCNLFIRNLLPDINDFKLAAMFQPFGQLVSAKVFVDKRTKRSRCFGFVSYKNAHSAQQAINEMNGKQLPLGSPENNSRPRLEVQIKRHRHEYDSNNFGSNGVQQNEEFGGEKIWGEENTAKTDFDSFGVWSSTVKNANDNSNADQINGTDFWGKM